MRIAVMTAMKSGTFLTVEALKQLFDCTYTDLHFLNNFSYLKIQNQSMCINERQVGDIYSVIEGADPGIITGHLHPKESKKLRHLDYKIATCTRPFKDCLISLIRWRIYNKVQVTDTYSIQTWIIDNAQSFFNHWAERQEWIQYSDYVFNFNEIKQNAIISNVKTPTNNLGIDLGWADINCPEVEVALEEVSNEFRTSR